MSNFSLAFEFLAGASIYCFGSTAAIITPYHFDATKWNPVSNFRSSIVLECFHLPRRTSIPTFDHLKVSPVFASFTDFRLRPFSALKL